MFNMSFPEKVTFQVLYQYFAGDCLIRPEKAGIKWMIT